MLEGYLKNIASLNEDEEIELIIRHYKLTFLKAFIKIIIPPLFVLVFIYMVGLIKFLGFFNNFLLSWTFLIILIIWATYSFYQWFIWYFDVAILTNQRVIVVEQKKLFEKSISEAGLDKIQDITTNISGLFPTLLGYGSVIVQTAGETNNLILKDIAKPQTIQQRILHLRDIQQDSHKTQTDN